MATMFDERERAAEYGFAHGEELRFLAVREGVEILGAWAANRMELHDEASYRRGLLDAFLGGTSEADLLSRVATDLRHAGLATAAGQASGILARATADATARQRTPRAGAALGHLAGKVTTSPGPQHPHGFWGWDVERR